ncbi:MAG: DUF7133 domain-containing protein [Akkermansiaceae bacterium]
MKFLPTIAIFGSIVSTPLFAQSKTAATFDPDLYKQIEMLSPEETIASIELPPGYSLEPVLSEPNITEPVSCVFDGNGRMYVIQMNTYMQDADATGENNRTSRISRHEDTNGDGKYDKHSVFVDNLLLPRMVLPLEDGIVVGTTNTHDLTLYKDTNNDGVADQDSVYYVGGKRGGNMEHQPSGLIWSLDNWVYTTYNLTRYKFGPEKMITVEPTASNGGQWGLTQDNYGKPWFVNAGGERGPVNYQFPIVYGTSTHFKDQAERNYKEVYPICPIPDVQGGQKRLKPFEGGKGEVLNHFTATCGEDIFRGDRLPEDLRGDLLFAEPVGRLIRRSKVEVNDGVTQLSNPHEKSEFIRSTDPNFRPVNMVTAPDGTLYIVDMYRGIIQQGNWTKPKSYLRSIVDKYGFDQNIQHGRIYRLVHKDFKRGPNPEMIGASSSELVKYLSHPNGWWRDTAQKFLVLRGDKSVANKLASLLTDKNNLTRIHALWTLEGIGALSEDHLRIVLTDKDPTVVSAGIRVSETLIKAQNSSAEILTKAISNLTKHNDPSVVMQAILTANLLSFENLDELKATALQSAKSAGVKQTVEGLSKPKDNQTGLSKNLAKQYKRGDEIYQQLCGACHGEDGKGVDAGGSLMAPPLSGSKSVNAHRDHMINILLHGLEGPVDGETYTAPMVAMDSQDDQWIADVVSYVRHGLGNRASFVTKQDVARVRADTRSRKEPWTIKELQTEVPQPLDKSKWKVTASHNEKEAKLAIDDNDKTRYSTGKRQEEGMWFQIEFPSTVNLASVKFDTKRSVNDYPDSYKAEISTDGRRWTEVQKTTRGEHAITTIAFPPTKARYFRVTTKSKKKLHWSIHEIEAYAKR